MGSPADRFMRLGAVVGGALVLLAVPPPARAQEVRGSIEGHVKDSTGAVVPGVPVVITNAATHIAATVATDPSGRYLAIYLQPGLYTVSVEAKGFKKLSRSSVEVQIADRLTLDLVLETGGIEETVEVSGGASLLDTVSASLGQVIDEKRITDLPLSDHNPFTLARLASGAAYAGSGFDLKFARPFDNGGTSAILSDGASGGNEFTLDGAPNMANGRRVAFVPPADAVQEFKVQTANFDAQQGHTAGAVINVAIRSGTNDFHGMAQYLNRGDNFAANDYFLNRQGAPKGKVKYNLGDAMLSGPVRIPGLYDGRDRTFFMAIAEVFKDQFPEPNVYTVPTQAERSGDFSALLPLGLVIYDPLTAVKGADGRITRTPFPNNIIPANRINPVAANFLKYFPTSNVTGQVDGRNNYSSENPRSDDFNSETVRLDHHLSDNQQMSLRYSHNYRRESRNSWTGDINGIIPTGNYLFRINHNAVYDHTYTANSSTVLDVKVGFSRFLESNQKPSDGKVNLADLGFSSQTLGLFGDSKYLPHLDIGSFSAIGDNRGDSNTFNIYSFQPTLTKVLGQHQVRTGYDLRLYRENHYGYGFQAGDYLFRSDYTKQTDTSPGQFGQDLAAFMLGVPNSGGKIENNASRANETVYHSAFVQDDWRVSSKLTVNLGVRYEYEAPTTERYNRNVRGFDFTSPSPIQAAAKAAYANSPAPQVPVSSFQVLGGLQFASPSSPGFWNGDKSNIQPRVGFAYKLDDKTVARGGWGIFTIPNIIDGIQQPGFSQSTGIVPTADNGLTFRANIQNPFPNGVNAPFGSSLGLATFIGQDIEFFPLGLKNGRAMRWQASLQRELPGRWLLEVAYVGTHSYDLTTTTDITNAISTQYLSTSPVRDVAVINLLNTTFPNPFKGLSIPGTNRNDSNTISLRDLLRPYPEFNRIRTRRSDGTSDYWGGQVRLEKRFSNGFTLNLAYTRSKLTERVSFLNESDTQYENRISRDDIPHNFIASGIAEFPFGKGRKWASHLPGALDAILGGWQLGFVYQFETGRPIDTSTGNLNTYFSPTCDVNKLTANVSSKTVDGAFDTSCFYFHDAAVQTNGVDDPAKQRADTRIRLSDNLRTFPTRIESFRGQNLNLWNISLFKNFTVKNARLQLRAEFINAFNHPQFNDPNLDPKSTDFGKVTSQFNLPRSIQVGAKFTF